jgi:hypothetical protein
MAITSERGIKAGSPLLQLSITPFAINIVLLRNTFF